MDIRIYGRSILCGEGDNSGKRGSTMTSANSVNATRKYSALRRSDKCEVAQIIYID